MLNLNPIWKQSTLVLILAAYATGASAAKLPSESDALATVGGDGGQIVLAFNPSIQNTAGSVLIIAFPDGKVVRQEFQGHDAPFINGPLPDGTYTYEVSLNPVIDAATQKALQAARHAANGQEVHPTVARLQAQGRLPSSPQVQFGSFTIENGILVSPDTPE